MVGIHKLGLRIMFLFAILLPISALSVSAQSAAEWKATKRRCGLPDSLLYNNWDGRCPAQESRNNNPPNTSDNGEAARQAEEKRRADEKAAADEAERQRVADETKRKKEAADRQKAFEKDRDETLQILRGSGNNSTELRGVDSKGTELRGSSNQETGLRGSTPSNDPMVVDAQNVSSGLSKDIDDAIDGVYKDAPPGVADRVSKGFQSVMSTHPDHWKDAKAWFQDALNHDPTNIGLKRLVALCDYTYSRPNPVAAKPIQAAPNNMMSATERAAYLKIIGDAQDRILADTTMSSTQREADVKVIGDAQDRIFAEDFDRQINSFYRNYASKHPELKFRVIVRPAKPAPAKKDESPIDKVLRRIQELVRQPQTQGSIAYVD